MTNRIQLAKDKGCDAVEPDNVDGYTNNPGFTLTYQDQIDYNRFLAEQAHSRNLSIGLKNNLDQIKDLVDLFDFAVNEQCYEYDECDTLNPFIAQNKAVFNAEYKTQWVNDAAARQTLCQDSIGRMFSTLVLPLNLDDAFRFNCLNQ